MCEYKGLAHLLYLRTTWEDHPRFRAPCGIVSQYFFFLSILGGDSKALLNEPSVYQSLFQSLFPGPTHPQSCGCFGLGQEIVQQGCGRVKRGRRTVVVQLLLLPLYSLGINCSSCVKFRFLFPCPQESDQARQKTCVGKNLEQQ